MSFGFAVGDFIAVGQLAQSLYKDVYLVARGAPEEVRLLMSEIAILSQSIDLLIEEVKSPTSTLIRAGESRVNMVNEVVKQANVTLKDLEKFAKKYDFGDREGGRAKLKRTWDKLKFAREKSSIDELRTKVQYHNGAMNLLLTAAGNSSLERMESFNKQIKDDIGGIQELLVDSAQIPVISTVEGKTFQITLSQQFLREAERVRPWRATGLDEWIQGGRWWLMKSQARLYSYESTTLMVPTQAYADLLKASWILIDIISKHPQQRFWSPTSEFLQVQLLVEMLKSELETIKRLGLQKPDINEIEQVDLRIWLEVPLAVSLRPRADGEVEAQGFGSWQILGEEVYFQGFGQYRTDIDSLEMECMVLVLVNKSCDNARLVVQTQRGVDLLDIHIQSEFLREIRVFIQDSKISLNFRDGQVLFFNTNDEFIIFRAILVSAVHYFQRTEVGPGDHKTLHSFVLLSVIEHGGRRAVQQVVTARRRFISVEQTMALDYDSTFENIWSLAGSLAAIILNSEGDDPGRWILPDHSKVYLPLALDEEAHSWLYRLLKAPATVLDSSWVALFQPYLIFRDRLSLLHAAFYMAVWRGNDAIVRAVVRGIINWSEEYYYMKKSYLRRLGIHCESVTPGSVSITALELAAASGHSTVVKLLLDHGPKISGRVGCGESLLHMATERGNEGIVKLLLDHKVDVEARNLSNLTALHLAASKGHQQVLRAMLESGANVDSKTHGDWTPLHLAIFKGYEALAQVRLHEGASVKAVTANGETTLHKVVESGYTVVARLLIDYGADLTAKTSEGWAAIHLAAYYGTTEIVELLLEKGANIEEEAEGGVTALHLAASKSQEDTVRLLLKNGAKATTSDAT